MKKIMMMAVTLLLFALRSQAQVLQPVHWSYAAKKINAKEAVIFIKATIDQGWHVYSQFLKEGGPVKTTISFDPSGDFVPVGKTTEPKPITRMEKVFAMEVGFFENSVIFQQKIRLKSPHVTVKGKLEYMTCNDQKCLPPDDIDFSIPVK